MTEEHAEHHDQDMTPAVQQAALFAALAQHLTRHPHLTPLYSVTPSVGLHIDVGPSTPQAGAALVEWADTLTNPTVMVRRIEGEAFVSVTGAAGPAEVRVWAVIPGLLDALEWRATETDRAIDMSQLRAIVAGQEGSAGETAHHPRRSRRQVGDDDGRPG